MLDESIGLMIGCRLDPELRESLTTRVITLDAELAEELDGRLRAIIGEWARPEDASFWHGEAFEHLRSTMIELAIREWN